MNAQFRQGFAGRRRSKYGAVRTEVDGLSFASKKEATRYSALKLLERVGEISGLTLQPRFSLDVGGFHICTYVADFAYRDKSGAQVTEDTKGVVTDVFAIKKRLMKAVHGINVVLS